VRRIEHNYFVLFALLGLPIAAFTQSITLSIGSSSGTAGGTVSLPISLSSSGGAQTAGLQWTFTFSSDITGVTVVAAPLATSAAKSVSCSGNNCLIFGLNSNVMADGTVATATFQIASNPSTATIPVQLTSVVASTALGASISATGGSGVISLPSPAASLSGLSCTSTTLNTSKVTYSPLSGWGYNSNAFTYTLLSDVGLVGFFGHPGGFTPGWGQLVPGLKP